MLICQVHLNQIQSVKQFETNQKPLQKGQLENVSSKKIKRINLLPVHGEKFEIDILSIHGHNRV